MHGSDRDGDRLSDLERQVAPPAGGDRVDMIVTLADPASRDGVGRLERGVGDLVLRNRFRSVDGFAARVTERQVAALANLPASYRSTATHRYGR